MPVLLKWITGELMGFPPSPVPPSLPLLAWDHMPDISEYERWFYNFGPYRKCVCFFLNPSFLLMGY